MVFQNNLIAVTRSNGKILRERNVDGTQEVTLPFGSDYSILLKNKDSRRVVVKVEIDGQDVLDHNELVIGANSETELAGFMSGNEVRNKFRFIKKTQEISDHRGDRVDDGIIRISFRYEQRVIDTVIHHEHHYHYAHHYPEPIRPWPYPYPYPGPQWTDVTCRGANGGPIECDLSESHEVGSLVNSSTSVFCNNTSIGSTHRSFVDDKTSQDPGITVKGQSTYQSFSTTFVGQLESQSYTINIVLRGTDSVGQVVAEPITVTTKLICSSCGTVWESTHDYCGSCGTYLR